MDPLANLLTEYEGRLARGISHEELVGFASQLPALPHSAAKLIRLADDPNSDLDDINTTIASDAAIAAAMLKLANSTAFAQQRKVVSIPHALGIVGLRSLKSVVLAQVLTRLNRQPTLADRLVRDHAIATALLMRGLAQRLGRRDADDLFLYGVLHRLGQFVLLADTRTRNMFPAILRRIKDHHEDYVAAELEEIGFSHPLIGALVANRWNFPLELSQTILRHHDPFEGLGTDTEFKTWLVKFCSAAAHVAKIGTPEGYPDQFPLLLDLGLRLGLLGPRPEAEVQMLVEDLQAMFTAEAKLWPP